MEDILSMSASSLRLSQEDSIPSQEETNGYGQTVALHQRELLAPGEVEKDGSWIDAKGIKHYSYGNSYVPTKADKRMIANGDQSGRYQPMKFTPEEIEANPYVGLSAGEIDVLTFYMQGHGRQWIAEALGISEQTVTSRLATKQVKICRMKLRDLASDELEDAITLAAQAVRDGLSSGQDIQTRLKASDRVFKVTGKYNDKPSEKTGAEDMIQKMLSAIQTNVTVNVNTGGGNVKEGNNT